MDSLILWRREENIYMRQSRLPNGIRANSIAHHGVRIDLKGRWVGVKNSNAKHVAAVVDGQAVAGEQPLVND